MILNRLRALKIYLNFGSSSLNTLNNRSLILHNISRFGVALVAKIMGYEKVTFFDAYSPLDPSIEGTVC